MSGRLARAHSPIGGGVRSWRRHCILCQRDGPAISVVRPPGEPRGVSPRVGVPYKFRVNSRVSGTRRLTLIGSPEEFDANVRSTHSMEFAVGRPVNRRTTAIWRMHPIGHKDSVHAEKTNGCDVSLRSFPSDRFGQAPHRFPSRCLLPEPSCPPCLVQFFSVFAGSLSLDSAEVTPFLMRRLAPVCMTNSARRVMETRDRG
jgi:hypothetical protein